MTTNVIDLTRKTTFEVQQHLKDVHIDIKPGIFHAMLDLTEAEDTTLMMICYSYLSKNNNISELRNAYFVIMEVNAFLYLDNYTAQTLYKMFNTLINGSTRTIRQITVDMVQAYFNKEYNVSIPGKKLEAKSFNNSPNGSLFCTNRRTPIPRKFRDINFT